MTTIFLSESLKNLIDEKDIEAEIDEKNNKSKDLYNINHDNIFKDTDKLILKFIFENKEQKDIALVKFKRKGKDTFSFDTKINTNETVYFLQNNISQLSFFINDLLIQQFNSFQFDIYYSISYISSNNYNLKVKVQKRAVK